jgi:type IX secretion system PorP/SprF family membrane protein
VKKYIVISLLILLEGGLALGQDNFYYNQYHQVAAVRNPAFTGIDNFLDIKLNFRSQWNGFSDAPTTSTFGIIGYLQNETPSLLGQYGLRTSHIDYIDSLLQKSITYNQLIRHGLGSFIVYDVQGPYEQISANLNYAIHLPLGTTTKISLGVAAAIINQRYDLDKIRLQYPDEDEFYQSLVASGGKSTELDIYPGVVIYGGKAYISYAVRKLISRPITSDEVLADDQGIGQEVMAGIQFRLSDRIKLLPSVYWTSTDINESIVNSSLKVLMNEKTWAGISYRTAGSISAMAGVYLGNKLNLSYSYDYITSELNNYTNGTHEIVLGLMLVKKDSKAPYLW